MLNIKLLSHQTESFPYFFNLPEGKCVSVCPDGFYGNEESNDCEECHLDCATCSGPEDSDCLSCHEGKALYDGVCVSEDDDCPGRTFLSGETNNLYSTNPTVWP